MSASDDDSEKQFDATQKKLDDARKKGDIAKSTDLNTAVSYFGILITVLVFGAESLQSIGMILAGMIENAEFLSRIFFVESAKPVSGDIGRSLLKGLGYWLSIPGLLVLLVILAQSGFVVAPDKLVFNFRVYHLCRMPRINLAVRGYLSSRKALRSF